MTGSPLVLVVEPDSHVRTALSSLLRRRGYAVEFAHTAAGAEARLAGSPPDLLVSEVLVPGGSGFGLAERAKGNGVPVVLVSGLTHPAHRDFAHASGVDVFLPKPFRASSLLAAVSALCPTPARRTVRFAEAV